MNLLIIYSSVWLEVGLSHPQKIQQFTADCHLELVSVFNDFTNRHVIGVIVIYYLVYTI